MKNYSLFKQMLIPEELQKVFPFFAHATNLEFLTPPYMNFRVVNPLTVEMRPGALINYKLRIRGIPTAWQSEITVWDPPFRFVDEQRRGPYKSWVHEHIFEQRGSGTLVTDSIQYSVIGIPFLHRFVVKPDLEKIFAYREKVLIEIFGP